MPWEVLIFVGSTQNHTKLVQFQQAEGITALNCSTTALGCQLNPAEAEYLCSDIINTSPAVCAAVALLLLKSLK